MPRHLRLFFFAFGAWAGLLGLLLALGHTVEGKAIFASRASAPVYVGLQGILTSLAFSVGVWALVRGPNTSRLLVLLPLIVLAVYGAMLIAGPG